LFLTCQWRLDFPEWLSAAIDMVFLNLVNFRVTSGVTITHSEYHCFIRLQLALLMCRFEPSFINHTALCFLSLAPLLLSWYQCMHWPHVPGWPCWPMLSVLEKLVHAGHSPQPGHEVELAGGQLGLAGCMGPVKSYPFVQVAGSSLSVFCFFLR
jgi:hypothetical protein